MCVQVIQLNSSACSRHSQLSFKVFYNFTNYLHNLVSPPSYAENLGPHKYIPQYDTEHGKLFYNMRELGGSLGGASILEAGPKKNMYGATVTIWPQ